MKYILKRIGSNAASWRVSVDDSENLYSAQQIIK